MNNEIGNIFVKRLRTALKEKCITQKELARRCGLTEASICRYMDGSRIPRVDTLIAISRALNLSADYLMGLDDKKWVFTFCCGETHQHHGKFVRIPAKSYEQARDRMVTLFGTDWAFQYEEADYEEAMNKLPNIFRETEMILTDEQLSRIGI